MLVDLCRTYYTRNCILQDTDWSKVQAEIAKIAGELHVCTRTIAFTLWLLFLCRDCGDWPVCGDGVKGILWKRGRHCLDKVA